MNIDEACLARLRNREAAAWEQVVAAFERPVYRFFYCKQRDHHLAEEQTAETFAQLVRSFATFRGGHEQFRAFVFAIARNIRWREWRRPRNEPLEASAVLDSRSTPQLEAEDREQLRLVMAAIGELEEIARDAFLLRFVEGFSLAEVADALDCPVGTIKSHIHRGRAKLKTLFAKEKER